MRTRDATSNRRNNEEKYEWRAALENTGENRMGRNNSRASRKQQQPLRVRWGKVGEAGRV